MARFTLGEDPHGCPPENRMLLGPGWCITMLWGDPGAGAGPVFSLFITRHQPCMKGSGPSDKESEITRDRLLLSLRTSETS